MVTGKHRWQETRGLVFCEPSNGGRVKRGFRADIPKPCKYISISFAAIHTIMDLWNNLKLENIENKMKNFRRSSTLMYVIRNVSFTFDFKKLLENALRFVTDVVLNRSFAMLS